MNIETWQCHTTHSACNCVLERLNKLEKELEIARKTIKELDSICECTCDIEITICDRCNVIGYYLETYPNEVTNRK